MKCRNILTGNIFDVSFNEMKKLKEEYDCFEAINPSLEEKRALKNVTKKPLTIREKVMRNNKENKK